MPSASTPQPSIFTLLHPRFTTYHIPITLTFAILAALIAQPIPLTYVPGWSAPRPLATRVAFREPYQVVVDARGGLHLAWIQDDLGAARLYLARLDDAGAPATTPAHLFALENARASAPRALLDARGNPMILFVEKSEGESPALVLARSTGERYAGVPLRRIEGTLGTLSAQTDGSGGAFLVWGEQRQGAPAIFAARLDSAGDWVFAGARVSDELARAFDPAVIVAGGAAHVFYFVDDNKNVELRYRRIALDGRALAAPRVLSRRPQNSANSVTSYPLALTTDAAEKIALVESPGGDARLTRFDASGQPLGAPVTLRGVRASAAVEISSAGEDWQITWAGTRKGRLQIFTRAFSLDGAPRGAETRLTATTTSGAVLPTLTAARDGSRRLFWLENIAPENAALFTADTRAPAEPSVWQRLGFAGDNPFFSMLFTLAAGFMLAPVIIIVNIWRPLIALAAFFGGWRIAARLARALAFCAAGARFARLAHFAFFGLVFWLALAPIGEFIGQPAMPVAASAAITFAVAASAVCALLAARWRSDLNDPFRWLALATIWCYVYYWLNAIVLLREAFAV